MKPARKWRTPTSRARKEKEQPKADETNNAQSRTVNGVFMFGRAAQAVRTTKRPLVAVPELPSDHDHGEDKKDTRKKPRHWSKFGKFKVGTRKEQGAHYMGNNAKKCRGTRPKKMNSCEMYDHELRKQIDKRAKGKAINWKRRQQQKLKPRKC